MEDYEESKMAKDNIKVFKDKLSVTILKTPHVINDINYKNEDKFSFFTNSQNCYEDDRISEFVATINDLILPYVTENINLDFMLDTVYSYFKHQMQLKNHNQESQ